MPIYGWKRLFAGFKIVFTAFTILYLQNQRFFASIGCTIAKILAKTFILRLINRVYIIRRSIFRTLKVILISLKVSSPNYRRKCWFASYKIGCTVFAVIFLEHLRLFWSDWRYDCQDTSKNEQKRLFASFEIRFMVFKILFLENFRLFCIDWIYGFHDAGKNVIFPT